MTTPSASSAPSPDSATPPVSAATGGDGMPAGGAQPHWSAGQRTLRRSILVGVGGGGLAVLALVGAFLYTRMSADLQSREDARLRDDVRRAMLVAQQHLQERHRQVELIGSMPAVVDAAVEGARRSRELGLVGQPIPALEKRFDATRSLEISSRSRTFLVSETTPLDIAEMMLTDVYGNNAITTEKTSDFVQSDEGWWQDAFAHGMTSASAVYDESAAQVVVSVSAAVREHDDDRPVGVIKIQFGLHSLEQALAGAASAGTTTFDIVDSAGNVVATTGQSTRMRLLAGAGALRGHPTNTVFEFGGRDEGGTRRRGVMQSVNDGAWRLIGSEDASVLDGELAQRRQLVFGGLAVVLAVFLGFLALISRFIEARISAPVAVLARVSEAVAAGDLTVPFTPSSADDEIGRLGRAIATMVRELSRLASELQSAGSNTATYASSITQGAEGLSASAQEIASTSNDLSRRIVDMAETIQRMSSDAARLVSIAGRMAEGAREGVERNAQLRTVASENRARLDVSATALEQLASTVAESAQAIEALAQASEEIRTFVTLVQKMSRQSKLLALNAAMEAARAGEHGQGFAVVANEVRRLAAGASDSAERTEGLVRGVLERIERSRESSARSVETLSAVREATRHGLESFGHVEQAVVDSETWTGALAESAATSSQLVHEMTQRLGQLAAGADSFASAMQEVAATTQEQSASTEEIAAIATSLAGSAERLRHFVATFRLESAVAKR